MIEWLEEFYGDDLRTSLLASLAPLFAGYAREIWLAEGGRGSPPAAFVSGLAAAYADHHLNSSRIQLQELVKEAGPDGMLDAVRERLDEWSDSRPEKVAANETIRTSNAIAIEHMRSEGVVTKVWSASGSDTCPYCEAIDGTAVEIERSFFSPGDSFQPEGADTPLTFTSEIGGPPCHRGCVCSVRPA